MVERITTFRGDYFFLSNFYVAPNGSCVEIQFQALKATNEKDMVYVLDSDSPKTAKTRGHEIKCRDDWDRTKLARMFRLVKGKFSQEPLKSRLLATGDAELVEGNWWGDTYWGVCRGIGENHLGKILMLVRDLIREEEQQ